MAKFCTNCGNPIDENDRFCEYCGANLSEQRAQQSDEPSFAQPRPEGQQYEYGQPRQTNSCSNSGSYGYGDSPNAGRQDTSYENDAYVRRNDSFENEAYVRDDRSAYRRGKSSVGLVLGVIIGTAAVAAIAVAVLVRMGILHIDILGKGGNPDTSAVIASSSIAEERTDASPAGVSEDTPVAVTDALPADDPGDTLEVSPDAAPEGDISQGMDELPYMNSLGLIVDSNFAWISSLQEEDSLGDPLEPFECLGRWKAEIIDYENHVFQLVYLTIDRDASITIEPFLTDYGAGWSDVTDEPAYRLDGTFTDDGVYAYGDDGNMTLYSFSVDEDNIEYARGSMVFPSGETANVYLMRP